mmetsp:Transcript_33427/g.58579  ORF Transcript_33427/g.58579 Transcript_33427/m.58579 type:complete len:167 (+) Transcript_33427:1057-1557(+)
MELYCLEFLDEIERNMMFSQLTLQDSNFLLYYSQYFTRRGDLEKALDFGITCKELLELNLRFDHPKIAEASFNLASVHKARGDLEKAKELFTEGIQIGELILHSKHLELARAYHELGKLCTETKEYLKATEMLTKSLDIRNEVLCAGHASTKEAARDLAAIKAVKT